MLLPGVEVVIGIYDMVKSDIEYDNIVKRFIKIIYQRLSSSIALNLVTEHYHKFK